MRHLFRFGGCKELNHINEKKSSNCTGLSAPLQPQRLHTGL